MQIGKKIYYELLTGNVILEKSECSGDVIETTQEQDFQSYQALAERVPETVGMIQLAYGQYAQDFAECNGYHVNPVTLTLEFSYPDPNLPPEEQAITYRTPLSEEVNELKTRTQDIELALADIMLGGM